MEKVKVLLDRYLCPCLMIMAIIIYAIIAINKDEPGDNAPVARLGIPEIYCLESDQIDKRIDQIVDDGQRLYVLFDKSCGIVQVYDMDGNYLNTIAFYCERNGAFKLAVSDKTFYVQDKHANLYLFRDGEFIDFVENKDNKELRRSIDFKTNSPNFEVRLGSVWKVTEAEEVCVIERPLVSVLNQQNQMTAGIAIIFVFGLYFYFRKTRLGNKDCTQN